ncbi:DUF1850 domain-containing protein [Tepidibacillus sp. LV47]|uniref:DUF1850 domain-containing protein n=1 Tax=Tepidibacillus sp. LV47 TaxID=3398228 RepID=UPI003AAABA6A
MIILIMLLLYNLPLVPMLTLIEGDSGKILLRIPINGNDRFSIEYIHSIHKTPVIDTFYIDSNQNIIVDQTTFDTYGVGMPSDVEKGETFTIKNGKFVLNHLNRVLPYFDLRVGQVIANHQFIVHQRKIPLAKLTRPGNWVRFKVQKLSLLQLMKGGSLDESRY